MTVSKDDILRFIEIQCPVCNVYSNPRINEAGEIVCPVCGHSLKEEVLDFIEEERPNLSKLFIVK